MRTPPATASRAPATAPAVMSMMQGALEPSTEMVPRLMRLSVGTDSARADLARLAGERMLEGTTRLARGVAGLAAAEERGENAAMSIALQEARHGLGIIESAISARAALDTSVAPAEVADAWLRSELGLPVPVSAQASPPLSSFHLALMTILLLFFASMVVIHYRRMRAIEALLAAPSAAASGSTSARAET